MKDRVCTLSVRKKTSTVKIRTSSERNKVRKREFFFFNKNRTVKRQWRPSRRLVRVCDGLAARGCACPALGVLPEGCVEIASNSYALKLRVLVGAVVCSPDVCSQLHWQLEEQAHRRGYSAETRIMKNSLEIIPMLTSKGILPRPTSWIACCWK